MNTNKSGLLGLTTILTAAILKIERETGTVADSSIRKRLNTLNQDKSSPVLFSGKLESLTNYLDGTAEIFKENSQFYLKLNLIFNRINTNSDFYLLLDPKKQPPAKYSPQDLKRSINLGVLGKSEEVQYYSLSEIQNPAQYKSVAICSRRTQEVIAHARLKAASKIGSIMQAIGKIGDIIENQ